MRMKFIFLCLSVVVVNAYSQTEELTSHCNQQHGKGQKEGSATEILQKLTTADIRDQILKI